MGKAKSRNVESFVLQGCLKSFQHAGPLPWVIVVIDLDADKRGPRSYGKYVCGFSRSMSIQVGLVVDCMRSQVNGGCKTVRRKKGVTAVSKPTIHHDNANALARVSRFVNWRHIQKGRDVLRHLKVEVTHKGRLGGRHSTASWARRFLC